MQYVTKLNFIANGVAAAPGKALSADEVKTLGKCLPELVEAGVIAAVKPAVVVPPKKKDEDKDPKKPEGKE